MEDERAEKLALLAANTNRNMFIRTDTSIVVMEFTWLKYEQDGSNFGGDYQQLCPSICLGLPLL